MTVDVSAEELARWSGRVTPYAVGDPGRAPAAVVPLADRTWPDRPDTVLDGFSTVDGEGHEVLRVRAASIRGLAHRWYGTVRQDDYCWRVTEDERYLVVCVADGVSAGPLSHLAAVIATRYGTEILCARLRGRTPTSIPWSQVLTDVADAIHAEGARSLRPDAEPLPDNPSRHEVAEQMATTVLYAIVDLVPEEDRHNVVFFAVGDTSAWVLTADGRWEPQQPVKNEGAELHSSSVFALPMVPAAVPTCVRSYVRPGEAFVLMTDGVGDPLGGGGGEVGAFLAEVWREPPGDLDFAAQVGFSRRTYDDDRTAFAIWPVGRVAGDQESRTGAVPDPAGPDGVGVEEGELDGNRGADAGSGAQDTEAEGEHRD
jgi:hypothetical protein